MLLDKDLAKNSNLESLSGDNASAALKQNLFTGEKYQTTMKYLLKEFYKMNVLNDIY